MEISILGYALLGLTAGAAQTGYALRKIFEDTPMGNFSSSPGSIYPALKKLIKNDLLEQRNVNGKSLHHITDAGKIALKSFLRTPVTKAEIQSNIDHTLLRFAFLQGEEDISITLNFLNTFENAVQSHIDDLQAFMKSESASALTLHGRLAMENGIRSFQAHHAWSIYAQQEFSS